ncbi:MULTISPECIES: ankyrin repeat domain-containing protein [unclassified Wolbachia]|uniref:ankyrin repeat domain-containing protein n=1 Tax=unclassified Wolbachia TaxID=2640676 RepID=UPI0022272CA1|nr:MULTISPECIES: ankyrin repeat domain-containing protein [unclassified Wolbachia]
MMDSDHYEVLGVKPDATQHKIRQEYHRLSKEYHPDRFLSPGERDKHRKLSERKKDGESLSSLEEEQLVQLEKKLLPFKKISFAYGTLSDSKKRERYDRKRESCTRDGYSQTPRARDENNDEASEEFDEEFDISYTTTLNELRNTLSKAVNGDDYQKLNEVIRDNRYYVFITSLNSDNFKAFCSEYLNLDLHERTDRKYIYDNILSKYNLGTEGGDCNFLERELILLAIAANNKLAEKYQDVLLNQEDLELKSLLLLVGGQKYIDILSDKLKEKDNRIKVVSHKFFSTIALRKEFNQLFTSHITQYLKTLKDNNIVDTIRNILDAATSVQNKECIKAILVSSRKAGLSGASLLYLAACYSRETAQDFLNNGISVNVKDINDMTPLHFIARNVGQVAQKDTNNGWFSVLPNWLNFSSSSAGNDDTAPFREGIEFLLGKGANIDAKDSGGMTPLHFAVCNGNLEMIKFLVKEGADFDLECKGKTVLDLARSSESENKEEVIKFFEEEVEIGKRRTPLHYAILSDNSKTLKLLLEQERFINAQDSENCTPLALAIEKSKLEAINLLLNHEDYFDFSYLSLAIKKLKVSNNRAKDIFNLLAEKLKKEFDETKAQLKQGNGDLISQVQVEKLKETEAKLARNNEALEQIQIELKVKKQEFANKEKELEGKTKEVAVLLKEKNGLTSQVEKLKQANAELKEKASQVEENSQLKEKLNSEVNELREESNRTKAQLKEKEGEVSKLNDQVTQFINEKSQLRDELNATKAQLVDLQKKLDDAKQLEENLNGMQQSLKGPNPDNGSKKLSAASAQGRKQITYASISFVLSGAFAVGASLTMFHSAVCIILSVAALTFLAVGCYCSYKANTALSNVETDQVLKDPERVVSQNSV